MYRPKYYYIMNRVIYKTFYRAIQDKRINFVTIHDKVVLNVKTLFSRCASHKKGFDAQTRFAANGNKIDAFIL